MSLASPEAGFVPHHLSALAADMAGNGGRGRYFLLPGSSGRARKIGERFDGLTVRTHPRGHDVFLGTIQGDHGPIDVGAVSTGMGAPSLEIIATELFHLGARRFLRVGTSGSMQPGRVRASDYVIATAAVRDDGASRTYAPAEFPAVASISTVLAGQAAARRLGLRHHSGVVHSKDAFYAREFGHGPLGEEHARYRAMLTAMNTLASEMEASMLFTLRGHFLQQAQIKQAQRDQAQHDHTAQRSAGETHAASMPDFGLEPVLAGALFLIIGEDDEYTDREAELARATETLVDLGIETVRQLDALEQAR